MDASKTPPVSLHKPEPADELTAARTAVEAQIAAVAPSLRPPTLSAPGGLRALPPELASKLISRVSAGLAPLGTEHPRGRVWQRVVLPSGSLAVLDAVGLTAAALDGRPLLTVAAAVVFVPFAAAAASAARFATRDPLRLSTAERRTITDACHWESKQVWTGPLSAGRERGLVVVATVAAGRIAASPAWSSPGLEEHRLRLDLLAELDQIDAQAFRLAAARPAGGSSSGRPPSAVEEAWAAVLTRVAALTCYADGLDALVGRQATARALEGDPARDSALLAGSARDEIAADDLAALRYFLSAAVTDTGPVENS